MTESNWRKPSKQEIAWALDVLARAAKKDPTLTPDDIAVAADILTRAGEPGEGAKNWIT